MEDVYIYADVWWRAELAGTNLESSHIGMMQVTTCITVSVIDKLNFSRTSILCILQQLLTHINNTVTVTVTKALVLRPY